MAIVRGRRLAAPGGTRHRLEGDPACKENHGVAAELNARPQMAATHAASARGKLAPNEVVLAQALAPIGRQTKMRHTRYGILWHSVGWRKKAGDEIGIFGVRSSDNDRR